MTKALGFLTGVCLTVALFVVTVQRLQHPDSQDTTLAAVTSDIEPVHAITDPTDEAPITVEREAVSASVEAETDEPASPDEAVVDTSDTHADQTAVATTGTTNPAAESTGSLALDREPQQDTRDGETTQTHIFWSPFRSQWAAEGFARRLSNATQIPIEIVEAGAGQYRVAFDYRDEGQRREHIERIESITGLQLE